MQLELEYPKKPTPKGGYRQTEVGLIPNEWSYGSFGDFLTLQRGFDLIKAEAEEGSIPVVSSSGISYYHNKSMVQPPGIVTGRKGKIGGVYYLNKPFWPHDTSLWVKEFKGNEPLFVYYFLGNLSLERLDAASAVPTLNRNNVHRLQVVIPPLPEQKAIAKALSDVDALITSLDQLIAKKRDIKQGTMQQLLTGKTRLPGFDKSGGNFKQTEVGLIPEDWEIRSFEELFTFLPTASFSRAELSEDDAVEYVHYGDIHKRFNNFIDFSSQTLPSVSIELGAKFPQIQDGDLIMADASEDYEGIGKCVEVRNIGPKNVISGLHTFLLRGKQSYFARGFCGYICENSAVKKQFDQLATGLKVYGLSKKSLLRVQIPLPAPSEQKAIAQVLSDMDAEITALEARRGKTKLLKQGMMQELLTGRTRLV